MDAEPSHLAGSMSLAPNTSVTDCSSSAAGAGWGFVICACVEDCRSNSSAAAPARQSVSTKDRFMANYDTGPVIESQKRLRNATHCDMDYQAMLLTVRLSCALVFATTAVYAQSTGRIEGAIIDPGDAAIAGAQVSCLNVDTGIRQ